MRVSAKHVARLAHSAWSTQFRGPPIAHAAPALPTKSEKRQIDEFAAQIADSLDQAVQTGTLELSPAGVATGECSPALQLAFRTYEPHCLGVVDYHGPSRTFQREQVGGINLNHEHSSDQSRNHSLYNYANKYNGIQTEMASAYVRQLIAQDAGAPPAQIGLKTAMAELFETFFPEKTFEGPNSRADGRISFLVRTPHSSHPLDDLSSGEKEVLYGYLRLRNANAKHNIVLMDEPELHLNPRLLRRLVSFYHRQLRAGLASQLWLVTHSDTIIRDAVGKNDCSVFHVMPAHRASGNQAADVLAKNETDDLILAMAGDLAAYDPNATVVLVEGGGDDMFDKRMIDALFPEFSRRVTIVSCGSKNQVSSARAILQQPALGRGRAFYSITDHDDDRHAPPNEGVRAFVWDVYHIENYLLDESAIAAALCTLTSSRSYGSAEIRALLGDSARTIAPEVAARRTHRWANSALVRQLNLGVKWSSQSLAADICSAAKTSLDSIATLVSSELALTSVQAELERHRAHAESALADGGWRSTFPGRSVLRELVSRVGQKLDYYRVRDEVLAQLVARRAKPTGMLTVLSQICPEVTGDGDRVGKSEGHD